MKILQINKFYYLRGGSEKYLFELLRLLEKNGHTVIPFSMKDSRNWDTKYNKYFAEKVDLDKFSLRNIFNFFYNRAAVKKLERLIKNEKPDIAHLHNIAHHLSPAIIKVLKKYGIPVVQTLHDYKLICPNYRLFSKKEVCQKCNGGAYYNCLFRKCVKNSWTKSFLAILEAYLNNRILKLYDKVDLFIAPSQFMKNICVEFGVPAEKIRVVHNFVSLASLGPTTNGTHANFTLSGKEGRNSYILYFGRLSEEKGIDVLLEAMRKVKSGVKLKIAGVGPERKNYELRIKNYELGGRVEMLGPKYGEELYKLVNNCLAVIIPSVWPENMPLSMLESMALGKVVIASKIGGIPEIIKDGVNGMLFTAGDSGSLVEEINKLQKVDVDNLERNAVVAVVEDFSPEKHYKYLLGVYNSIRKQ